MIRVASLSLKLLGHYMLYRAHRIIIKRNQLRSLLSYITVTVDPCSDEFVRIIKYTMDIMDTDVYAVSSTYVSFIRT